MKKHILGFALVATIIGSISMGCGSEKAAGGSGSDSTKTKTDTTAVTAPTHLLHQLTQLKKIQLQEILLKKCLNNQFDLKKPDHIT
jgi:hypothetical protein